MNCFLLSLCLLFASYLECAVSFKLLRSRRSSEDIPPARCLQPPDTGICRASFLNYFYNSTSDECETFVYGGCLGNDNNFWMKESCELQCKSETDYDWDYMGEVMEHLIENKDACENPPWTGPCRALMYRYYFNGEKCETFVYGGCEGNSNNFNTEEECMARCGPKPENESDINEV